ncbi:MAG: S1 RNA-binding domain-containing protein, partial [Desulfuromonadales bacterium]|nr:S1 RNA-binding domain-containing protein [Desulfuromonadales bacterium]
MAEATKYDKSNPPIKRFKDANDEHNEHSEPGEFETLFQSSLKQPQTGEVVEGTVVQITPEYVMIDVGYKSEGCVPIEEFTNENGDLTATPGDKVNVLFQRKKNASGHYLLSKRRAEQLIGWDRVAKAGGEGGIIEGKIVSKVKGGLTVDIGLPAFLPASQI